MSNEVGKRIVVAGAVDDSTVTFNNTYVPMNRLEIRRTSKYKFAA